MSKNCVLEDKICIECGQCNICDIDDTKLCNNCGKCIDIDTDFKAIVIDDILQLELESDDEI